MAPKDMSSIPFGHSMPPDSPHNITFHLPGWDSLMAFRSGDQAVAAQIKRIYPRFAPWGLSKQFVEGIHRFLNLKETEGCLAFVNPDIFEFAKDSVTNEFRGKDRLGVEELRARCVDVGSEEGRTRVYVLVFEKVKFPSVRLVWITPGTGVTSRLCEVLLPALERGEVQEVDMGGWKVGGALDKLPEATWLKEGEAHGAVRRRIVGLLQRAPLDEKKVALIKEDDVYLYPTGMASIYRMHQYLTKWRPGVMVFLGSIFHNTFHLFHEAPSGYKHFGRVDGQGKGFDELEEYLEAERKEGRKISYLFVEFPSNPILISADLKRLRALSDKYDFPLTIDDTIGSFSNIDVVPVADVIMSSTTKSFSGYANVMGGSLVLPPSSPFYHQLKPVFTSNFHNEVFLSDAQTLLSNSDNYLTRSTTLNRNAMTVATYLHGLVSDPSTGITDVLYPPFTDTLENYKAFMRPATDDFTPGYGCLFSVDFASKDDAKIFYNNLSVFHGGHLGAHHTLAVPFNDLVLGAQEDWVPYHEAYGAKLTQVRVSVGLESEEELLDTFKVAVEKVRESKKLTDA